MTVRNFKRPPLRVVSIKVERPNMVGVLGLPVAGVLTPPDAFVCAPLRAPLTLSTPQPLDPFAVDAPLLFLELAVIRR